MEFNTLSMQFPIACLVVLLYGIYILTCARLLGFRHLGAALMNNLRHLVRLNLPIRPGMEMLAAPCNQRGRKNIQRIAQGLDRGMLLGDAMTLGQKLVTPVEAEVLRMGEMGGNLEKALDVSVEGRAKALRLHQMVFIGLTEPLNACVMIVGIVTFILPKFREMFEELGLTAGNLPRITQMLFAGHALIWAFVLLALAVCAGLFCNALFVRAVKRGRRFLLETIQRIVYHIPGVHANLRKRLITEFCLEISMLLRVGTPAPRALRVIAEGTMNPCFRDRVRRAAELCEQGAELPVALDKARLDPRIAWAGKLTPDSNLLADAFQQQHDDMAKSQSWVLSVAAMLLGPLFLLGMGMIVGFIVIGLFVPLLSLANSLM